ncbi:hypothetical protein [Enterococcus massiliensis]|uniref:hypothetical protein n=1 Tax=Enterococcus massiliensis TaxID=1640685 RepID=UPI00065DF668|nr:hypothetical protein [Enterococcus massiliensis]
MSLHEYHDRKKLKWQGFYLSEHTNQLAQEKKERSFIWPAKEVMTKNEIDHVLYEARLKGRMIAIQKEEINEEGLYSADIIGKIQGYDELGIYLADQKIDYDEIRHVAFHQQKKWSDLT